MSRSDELLAALQVALDELERIATEATVDDRGWWLITHLPPKFVPAVLAFRRGYGDEEGAISVGTVLADASVLTHIATNGPAEALRRVAADRRVLARHPGATETDECPGCGAWLDGTWCTPPGALCPELADLADRVGVTIQEDSDA